jgi:septal ring factor EnvC (AmiA/AmiB activator)
MIDLNIIIFLGLSGFVLFLFFYVLKRENAIEQKFSAIELSLEELNKEVFLLKKELKKNNSIESIKKLKEAIEDIVDDIKFLDEKNKELYEKIEEEVAKLQLEIKKSNLPNITGVNKHEEEKILSLYKNGYSIEEISRELRIPAGEIELILKFSNIL